MLLPHLNVLSSRFLLCSAMLSSLGLAIGTATLSLAPTQAAQTQPITLKFAAKVGSQTASCGQTYSLGQPATPQTLNDFRFYISEIALVDASGQAVPVTLTQDGKWQYQNVALLDFENRTGACANGTPELRDQVVGMIPSGTYQALRFTLGVPFALNHGDTALAPSPLNLTGLWWNWQLGYKFARIDLQRPVMSGMPGMSPKPGHGSGGGHGGKPGHSGAGFPIHLGSTGCTSASASQKPQSCVHPNRTTVTLQNFDPSKNVVVADLARLVGGTNLSQNQAQTAPGCMSEPNDRDCAGIFTSLGLPSLKQVAQPQTFFRVE